MTKPAPIDYAQATVRSKAHPGPFNVGASSAVVAGALIIAWACGMPTTLITMVAVFIPGMIVATVLLAISMAWIFIMHGRTKQTPRWVAGTGVMIAITMAELFALTYIASLAQATW